MFGKTLARWALLGMTSLPIAPQTGYSGPRPAKKDVPYLLQANRLIETEVVAVAAGSSKDKPAITAPGPKSNSRTPLPEPVFLLATEAFNTQTLSLNRFVIKENNRQAEQGKGKAAEDEPDLRLTIRHLDNGLFRIEAAQMLEPGEYFLFAQGSKQAFCFSVY